MLTHFIDLAEWHSAYSTHSVSDIDVDEAHFFELAVYVLNAVLRRAQTDVGPQFCAVRKVILAVCAFEPVPFPSEGTQGPALKQGAGILLGNEPRLGPRAPLISALFNF